MIQENHIRGLAESALEGTSLFVTGVRVLPGNHISVLIDGDNGVKIEDCVKLSRAIEGRLNRDAEDYSLDVGSHGASSPLAMPRQYRRHIGREFELKLKDGDRLTGTLIQADDRAVTLEWSEREAKAVGKGKTTVVRRREVPFEGIREGRIKLKF